MTDGLVILGAEVAPGRVTGVRCTGDRLTEIGDVRPAPGDVVVDAAGGALLAGLHDHHVHLMALAAAAGSVDLGGDDLTGTIARARARRPAGWLRATGWPAVLRGELDRTALDRVDAGPLRVQDATGSTWYLNSPALELVLAGEPPPAGMELDADGRPTGRLFRLDDWLKGRTGPATEGDVAAAAAALAARGVTGLTDATATNGSAELDRLAAAGLPQHLTVMTADPATTAPAGLALGPVKVLLDDRDLPDLDTLVERIRAAHRAGRTIAVHCVTVAQLALTLAAVDDAGPRPGDRIEHGAVVPDDMVEDLRRHGLTVVTQPGFVAARGDQYLDEVEAVDQPWLYRVAGLLAAGVPVRASSDAPYGPADPWIALAAAVERRAPSGRAVGAAEAVDLPTALALYSSVPLAVGALADLCLLDRPWGEVAVAPAAVEVVATAVAGRLVHQAP